jgi:DNA ligase-1
MENYALLKEFVDELNSSNSTLDKTAVLQKPEYDDPFIKAVIRATYDPFKQYYVTPKNLQKRSDLVSETNANLFTILDWLSARTVTGHDAITLVNSYIKNHQGYEELIYNIFERNLKIRISDKIINKVHKGLIPTFDVVLAKKYEDHMKKVNFVDGWWASRKLDGLRCICIIDDAGDVEFRSRTGKPFHTLDLVKEEIAKLNLKSTVFDGEICIVREDGSEDFAAIQSEYNKKDYTIPNPRYKIFDILTLEEFSNKKGDMKLSHRLLALTQVIPMGNSILSIVEQEQVRDADHLEELREKARKLGWEGIMIRKDIPYEGKRSDKLLKCKLFQDAEFEVVGTINKVQRVIVEEDGKTFEIEEDMLSKAVILYEGEEVGVGSGWSQEQRRLYYKHPEKLIGNEITVQYFEVSEDKTGKKSLRFPTVKAVWEGKRNV